MKKKLLSLVLAAAVMVSMLSACSPSTEKSAGSSEQSQAETSSSKTSEVSSAAESTSAESTSAGDELQDSLKGVTLVVGTSGTYGPFSYVDADGSTLVGYDIDLLKALQGILGFTIEGEKLEALDYPALVPSVTSGQLDLAAAALCATDERKKTMYFSDVYYDAGISVVVTPENETIKSVEDLLDGEYTVAVQSGTVSYEYASEFIPEASLQVYDSQALAYKAVENGQADATIYDTPGVSHSIKTGEINLKIVGEEFHQGQAPYALAISFRAEEENPGITEKINAAIKELTENGTIDKIKKEWV